MNVSTYFKASKSPAYGLIAVLPLMVAYEILFIKIYGDQTVQVRNLVDLTIRQILARMGLHNNIILVLILAAAVIALILRDQHSQPIRLAFLGGVIIESAVYASLVGLLIHRLTAAVLSMSGGSEAFLQQVMLSLGAGVYEELVFRAIIYHFTALPLIRYLATSPFVAYAIAAVLSSTLFAALHYLGSETFTWYSGYYRFFAGLFFCALYQLRGLGVASWTHAFYDLFLYAA
ncbi:CPBP family intramembrane metalloprotease [candidate division KSB1 bacterium]|nr:CPBP family intramembrane metalloprotease [candidate division KSB1 bacterium]